MSRYKHTLRYQTRYYRYLTNAFGTKRTHRPDAYGSSRELDNLIRNSAGRCAIDNYAKAVIVDHAHGGKIVATLKRTSLGITITRED